MKSLLAMLLPLLIQGCASPFACKGFPQFSACKSASQAYRATDKVDPKEALKDAPVEGLERRTESPASDLRVDRTQAQTLRIWQAPFEDDQGDLIGSSTLVTEIEPRRWRMGQNRMPVPRRLAPLQVATTPPASPKSTTEDRGGFPLFPSPQGPRRLHVEEVDYREP